MILLGLACEDEGHYLAITRLVDDALVRRHDWLMQETVEYCRTWRGYTEGTRWSKSTRDDDGPRVVKIDGRPVRLHGPIDGKSLAAGARMWRYVLSYFVQLVPRPDVVVLAQDGDGRQQERVQGLDQVRHAKDLRWPFAIVSAVPEPEIEAWHVAGFEPVNDAERTALAQVRADLSFDPRTESHRLTSQPNDAVTDAKRVLARLCGGCGGDADREAACLGDHARLRSRGRANGTADFLDDVDRHITPLFGRPQ